MGYLYLGKGLDGRFYYFIRYYPGRGTFYLFKTRRNRIECVEKWSIWEIKSLNHFIEIVSKYVKVDGKLLDFVSNQ